MPSPTSAQLSVLSGTLSVACLHVTEHSTIMLAGLSVAVYNTHLKCHLELFRFTVSERLHGTNMQYDVVSVTQIQGEGKQGCG